jgi:hypothetical protein
MIYFSPEWIQYDLVDAWSQSSILISAEARCGLQGVPA